MQVHENRAMTERYSGLCVALKAVVRSLIIFYYITLPLVSVACNVTASVQWRAVKGMNMSQEGGTELKLSGTQSSSWIYATAPLPFKEFEPGRTYRLEGWMKVEDISDHKYLPRFKVSVLDAGGKWIGDFSTFVYTMANRGAWQKLWVEFRADDRFSGGSIAVDKGGTSKTMTAVLYIKGISLTGIEKTASYRSRQFVSDEKFNNVCWPFNKSAVIGWTPTTTDNYRNYDVDFVSWGGHPAPDERSMSIFCKKIDDASKAGVKISASIGVKTNFAGFISASTDTDIRLAQSMDLAGKPFIVHEMADLKVKGYPAYWFSINNLKYRNYLKENAERVMQCKPFGLVIDDPLGDTNLALWKDGEYSDNGVAGFKNFLKTHYTSSELAQNDILDADNFDLRKYHRNYSDINASQRPLRDQIIDFQLTASAAAFQDITYSALSKLGRRVPVSGNINPASLYAGRLLMEVDYFSFECSMKADSGFPYSGKSLLSYKMADALKRPAVAMGSGEDHAFLDKQNLPGMYRCWVAEAYAFGHYFMAPYRLWAYSNSLGSYSYVPRHHAQQVPLFQFIKSHRHLFDNYQVVAHTALILSYSAYVHGRTDMISLVKALSEQNIPFKIIITGDDVLNRRLSDSELSEYNSLLVPHGSILSSEDSGLFEKMKISGRNVVKDLSALDKTEQITMKDAQHVRATLRAVKNDAAKPAVVHLLNGDYDVHTDSCRLKKDFIVSIPKKLLNSDVIKQVKYARPPSWSSRSLHATTIYPIDTLVFSDSSDRIEVRVPSLDNWGILILSSSNNI